MSGRLTFLHKCFVIAQLGAVCLAIPVVFFFFFPLSLFLIGAWLMVGTVWGIWKGRASLRWTQTEGVILSSSHERYSTFVNPPHLIMTRVSLLTLKVSYSYIVNGIEYVGHRPSFGRESDPHFPFHQFAKDNRVPVYYNPNNPRESVVVPGHRFFPMILAIVFGLVLVYGALENFDFSEWKNHTFFQAKDAVLLLGLAAALCWRRWAKRKPAQPVVPADGPASRGRG